MVSSGSSVQGRKVGTLLERGPKYPAHSVDFSPLSTKELSKGDLFCCSCLVLTEKSLGSKLGKPLMPVFPGKSAPVPLSEWRAGEGLSQ